MFVDSHCHINKIKRANSATGVAELVQAARDARVEHMLCVGVTPQEFPSMEATVANYPDVSMSSGIHPLYVKEHAPDYALLRAQVRKERVVAVGETGLDYYYDAESKALQQESFAMHVEIANEYDKPLIIHTRDARDDTLAILKHGHAERCGGVLHCFTESYEMAKAAIDDLDFYISISGIASFANAKELRETVKKLPLDKLLIETDSPWLAPVPHRGKENQPAYVVDVAKAVADMRGETLAKVAEQTTENFYRLFKHAGKAVDKL